jgi:hypothetical protein
MPAVPCRSTSVASRRPGWSPWTPTEAGRPSPTGSPRVALTRMRGRTTTVDAGRAVQIEISGGASARLVLAESGRHDADPSVGAPILRSARARPTAADLATQRTTPGTSVRSISARVATTSRVRCPAGRSSAPRAERDPSALAADAVVVVPIEPVRVGRHDHEASERHVATVQVGRCRRNAHPRV